jgi:hypothetical protein
MDHADEWYTAASRLEQSQTLTAVPIDICDSSWEAFIDEIDTWARRALAANGFGDY